MTIFALGTARALVRSTRARYKSRSIPRSTLQSSRLEARHIQVDPTMPGHVKKSVGPDPDPDPWLRVGDSLRAKLKAKAYDPKKSCWVPDKVTGGYAEGLIESTEGDKVTVKLLEGDDVVYVSSATPPKRFVNISVSVGSRTPAHAVSTGRVLLAALEDDALQEYLDQVTLKKLTDNTVTSKVKLRGLIEEAGTKGWSVVDQELEVGLRSISVPIHDKNGVVIAALNVACPSSRISPQDMHARILLELQAASQDITASLQY